MKDTKELRQKRASLVNDGRAILDKAEAEKRELTQEEKNQYDQIMDQVIKLGEDIEREERQQQLEREMATSQGTQTRTDADLGEGSQPIAYEFRSRALQGVSLQESDELRALAPLASAEYNQRWNRYLRAGDRRGLFPAEQRALQADADIYGGYLYAPMQFVDRLIQAVDNMVLMRQWATVYGVTAGESLGAPSLDNDPADPTWTSELAIGDEDSTMSFGQRELNPHPLAKYIKVSRKLLRKVPAAESLVINRLGYKFGVTAENAYLNGNGSGQPLGVFTASNQGISTSRDVSTGNTVSSPTFDGLIEAKYTLKPQYWPRARWMFHRSIVKLIAKLKDGEGQYIWKENVRVGEPDTILGIPEYMSEYAPSTIAASAYVGILGDFSWYWIADALQLEFQRLDELYAATNQVGFIGRLESDGMPVLEEAFVRVKLAAS